MTTTPSLKTDRLTLRPVRATDAGDLFVILDDFEVSKWLSNISYPYSLEEATEFAKALAGAKGVYGMEFEGRLIGTIGYGEEFGYWMGRPYWGQGLMREAAFAVLDACFAAGATQIPAGFNPENTRSARILEHMGFVEIGRSQAKCRARGHDVMRIDMILTRKAFEARNGN